MKNSLLGQLILLAFISIMASGSRQYFVFNHGLKWNEAKLYCESHYTDLATFITKSDVDSIDLKPYLVWIGLNRHRRWWHWSDGYYRSINWDWSNRNWWGGCAAVQFNNKKVYPVSCETYLMSVCRDRTTNTFVKEAKTWDQASDYCRDHYADLATFTKDEMNYIFTEFDFPIWIGMKNTELSSNGYYVNWTETGPSGVGDCVTISSLTKLMDTKECDARLPFICSWNGEKSFLLVKEKKSWEEALEHCRSLNDIGLQFDLVSVESGDDYKNMMSTVMEANTDEVWTGLRFLGDEWLWVNGGNTSNIEMPQCPTQEQRCGALSKTSTGSVEARHCSEPKNFLCYSFKA